MYGAIQLAGNNGKASKEGNTGGHEAGNFCTSLSHRKNTRYCYFGQVPKVEVVASDAIQCYSERGAKVTTTSLPEILQYKYCLAEVILSTSLFA